MLSSEELLRNAAKDGSTPEDWPRVQTTILQRLDTILKSEFPLPQSLSSIISASQQTQDSNGDSLQKSTQDSQNKENDPPHQATTTSINAAHLPPPLLSLVSSITRSLTTSFSSQPPHTLQRLAELILRPRAHYNHLGPYLSALDRVISVSSPTTHFPLPQAQLPQSASSFLQNGDKTPNTVLQDSSSSNFGSDESLGGALLTPIPWLRSGSGSSAGSESVPGSAGTSPTVERGGGGNGSGSGGEIRSESTETIDGPNGAGRVETVSVTLNGVSSTSPTEGRVGAGLGEGGTGSGGGGLREAGAVTQGELLRQEQEAGVVPVAQGGRRPGGLGVSITGGPLGPVAGGIATGQVETEKGDGDVEMEKGEEEEVEVPHARGPEVIGMEDMGPQGKAPGSAIDIEAAVGRSNTHEKGEQEQEEDEKQKDTEMVDAVGEGSSEAAKT
ncbi:MAG: hypothetical protein M1820_004923 [Bogoriella megaspora]|nr:MAG: hypothetical protein M1820_004923 [Bogoriella megaspora]